MKILQLNIWNGRLEKQIAELLKREDADVLCLQEVVSVPGGQSFFFLDMQEIQSVADYPHSYHSPSHTFTYMRRKASWGNAVLSRQAFEQTFEMYTYRDRTENFDFFEDRDYNVGRVLQHTVVASSSGSVHVLNHHGHHVREHKNGDKETLRQCKMIVDYIEKLEGPVVLCGDFNLSPESESLEQINAVLVNHAKERGVLTTRTPLTHKTEVCDYIFTSPDLQVKDFQVLDDIASDHKALTIEF